MVEIKLAQQLLGMGYTPEQIQTLDTEPDHLGKDGTKNVPPAPEPEPEPVPEPKPASEPAPAPASDQLLKVLQTMQTNMTSMQKQLQALAIRDITTPDQPKITAEDVLRGIILPEKKGDK